MGNRDELKVGKIHGTTATLNSWMVTKVPIKERREAELAGLWCGIDRSEGREQVKNGFQN